MAPAERPPRPGTQVVLEDDEPERIRNHPIRNASDAELQELADRIFGRDGH